MTGTSPAFANIVSKSESPAEIEPRVRPPVEDEEDDDARVRVDATRGADCRRETVAAGAVVRRDAGGTWPCASGVRRDNVRCD